MMLKKVAIVSTVGLIYDGITSVILSYMQSMDLSDLKVYIIGTIKVEPKIREQFETLGCQIVVIPSRRKDTISYFKALTFFLHKNKIDVLHAHGNSATLAIEMMAGFLAGCEKRIAHSHNTRCDQVKADKLLRPLFYHLYTDALACGQDAGEWLFPRRKFVILKNGREVKKYRFNQQTRDDMREKYNITNELVIGHVGGFVKQKNHIFLLEIYKEIHRLEPMAKLFMIGDGELRKDIEKNASELKDVITFTGNVENVQDYLQMMDGMLLPSLYEGLPLVAVEWQINGLPALLSDTIDKSCAITDTIKFMSLKSPPKAWAQRITKMSVENRKHRSNNENIKLIQEASLDLESNAEILRRIYLEQE